MGSWNIFNEIDLATAPGFAADLKAMIDAAETSRLRVDCSSISFLDTSGFYAFAAADRYARARGRTVVLTNLSRLHAKVLALCDWDNQLTIAPSPAQTT